MLKVNEILWTRIKTLAKEKKLTQDNLALKSGINPRTLKNWICRNITPDAFSIVSIAKTLEVSVEYLVTGETPSYQTQSKDALIKVLEFIETLIKDTH